MYCKQCRKYYTPFSNLLSLVPIQHRGQMVCASQGRIRKDIHREIVRVPRFLDIAEYNKELLQAHEEDQKRQEREERIRTEQSEKKKQYIDSLRDVLYCCVILSNKDIFLKEHKCPHCREDLKKEYVKVTQNRKYILTNVWHCEHCDLDFISPNLFYSICDKADRIIRGYYSSPFVAPVEMECTYQDGGTYLFIPQWALDSEKYDHRHLPPRSDEFYIMTEDEYNWVKLYHQPEEFPAELKSKSFLKLEGYDSNVPETMRRKILDTCVQKYGKVKVLSQLHLNVNLRINQKGKNYTRSINIWNSDIRYVESMK